MIRKLCFFGPKKMRFMQIESVLQTKNRSEPAKNRFSVALVHILMPVITIALLESAEVGLLKEPSDLGLHCLPFHLHFLDTFLYGKTTLLNLKDNYSNLFRCPTFFGFSLRQDILTLHLWYIFCSSSEASLYMEAHLGQLSSVGDSLGKLLFNFNKNFRFCGWKTRGPWATMAHPSEQL